MTRGHHAGILAGNYAGCRGPTDRRRPAGRCRRCPAERLHPRAAPWLAAYATSAAEAVAAGLGLLEGDDVVGETTADPRPGVVLEVRADPPRAVRAVRWSADAGWCYSVDPPWRDTRRWFPLPVEHDADPVTLAEVMAATTL